VVGRKNAVAVYELAGFADDAVPAQWDVFAEGLARFREGDFTSATEIFQQVTDDPAAQHYAQRCIRLQADSPESWDGVWEMTGK
jgi:adenylate cyclase